MLQQRITKFTDYTINTLGEVLSHKDGKAKKLKPGRDGKGYSFVNLYNSKSRSVKIHRLVAEAFIPNPENKPQVNHKNGIKTDNRVENLEWCTNSENQRHAYKSGIKVPKNILYGENHPNSKLNSTQVRIIRRMGGDMAQQKIGEYFGISRKYVSEIITKRRWAR